MIAVFEKSERLRHIGHLDIQRFVQRGLRRSELPVAYSRGFNPHILVTFASALSTGACGKREIMDVTLESPVTEEVFLEKMNRAMPPDMQLLEARSVEDRHPALTASLKAASYDLLIRDPGEAERLLAVIPRMMERESVTARRKTKSGVKEVDIKPLIYAINGRDRHIYCTLALTEGQICKPGMLMEALGREAGILPEEETLPPAGAEMPVPGADCEGYDQKTALSDAAVSGQEPRPGKDCEGYDQKTDLSAGGDGRSAKRGGKREKEKSGGKEPAWTDSFGNRVSGDTAAPPREGPVRMLVTRTSLLGEDENGVLRPLERL